MIKTNMQRLTISDDLAGQRLDLALQKMLPEHSRSRIQTWIKTGLVQINDKNSTAKTKVWGGDNIVITAAPNPEAQAFEPEDIPITIVYEDDELLVVNKPSGLVVHPAAGNWGGTLLNALLFHRPKLAEIPRCGIVHRLDKETSGLLVVAKTLESQTSLVRQLQARTVKREYRAIVWGQMWRHGKVEQPIGRHPHARVKMAVTRGGKPAITHYEVLERFGTNSYVRCHLETGRTHQIRVHMQYIKAPIVGDPQYGIGNIIPHKMMDGMLRDAILGFKRQALHAIKLGLIHPTTNEPMGWQIELADDMKLLLEAMRHEDAPDAINPLDFGVDENGLYIDSDGGLQDKVFEDEDIQNIDIEDDEGLLEDG